MARSSVNVILGQEKQPLGTSHAIKRPIEPDDPDAEESKQEGKRSILGAVAPLGRYTLGGYLKK